MGIARNFEYADAQARVRARIGAMPDASAWRAIADASDLDNLIHRLRDNGLGRWVKALPRSPDTATVEQHLVDRLRDLIGYMGRLLPGRWRGLRAWLRQGGELVASQLLAATSEGDGPAAGDHGQPHGVGYPARDPHDGGPTIRRQDHGGALTGAIERWAGDFDAHCPKLTGRERYVVQRVRRIVGEHVRQIQLLREQAARRELTDFNAQWRLRDQLAADLRSLLGGDPFHAGLILIYGLLELLQYEQCRALLIAQSRHWDAAQLMASGG